MRAALPDRPAAWSLAGMMSWLRAYLAGRRPAPARAVIQAAAPRATAAQRQSAAPPPARRAAGDAFTPTRPKPGRRQIVGRAAERARIVQAITDENAHVVLFSERGRGKTSLANASVEALRQAGNVVARHTCEASSTFETIVHGLAASLPASLLTSHAGDAGREGCDGALRPGKLTPGDVVALAGRLSCKAVVFVVDEFDRIEDEATRTLFADTIKQVSDRGIGLWFMIVGVSENLEQILGQHPSIQRNIASVHLPLARDGEIDEMLARGGADIGLVFAPAVMAGVRGIARGMPYMAQLLGLRIAQSALGRGSATAEQVDLGVAVERVLGESAPSVAAEHARLTRNGDDGAMREALRVIARAPQDDWGRMDFRAAGGAIELAGRPIRAEAWQALGDAGILRTSHGGLPSQVSADRAMVNHVLLLEAQAAFRAAPDAPSAAGSPLPARGLPAVAG